MTSDSSKCPICKLDCDITEEDLIAADCGACGLVTIHVHCKEVLSTTRCEPPSLLRRRLTWRLCLRPLFHIGRWSAAARTSHNLESGSYTEGLSCGGVVRTAASCGREYDTKSTGTLSCRALAPGIGPFAVLTFLRRCSQGAI